MERDREWEINSRLGIKTLKVLKGRERSFFKGGGKILSRMRGVAEKDTRSEQSTGREGKDIGTNKREGKSERDRQTDRKGESVRVGAKRGQIIEREKGR